VIKRINTTYHLEAGPEADRETIERVLGFHADFCPVARSVKGAIEVTTAIEYVG
jgi:uncharacterized OsmC-like protein